MAIVEMQRLALLGMLSDSDKILSLVAKSKCIQLKDNVQYEGLNTVDTASSQNALSAQLARVNGVLSCVNEYADRLNADTKDKSQKIAVQKQSMFKPLLETSFDKLMSSSDNTNAVEERLTFVEQSREEISANTAEIARLTAEKEKTLPYGGLQNVVSFYKDTKHVFIALGTIPQENKESLLALCSDDAMCEFFSTDGENSLVGVVCLKDDDDFFAKLTSLGFVRTSFDCPVLPKERLEEIDASINGLKLRNAAVERQIALQAEDLNSLRLFADYLQMRLKATEAEGLFPSTASVFLLEGWCPKDKAVEVAQLFESNVPETLAEFYDISDDEFAPTLNKNNAFVKPFESVTNGYTPQNYHEPDPNPPMSVFYFLIFGLMTADVGYGFVLAVLGFVASKLFKQQTGIKTLLSLFGVCGVSAMIWGALFNSYFCAELPFYTAIIPNPSTYPLVTIGISLGVGVLHLICGFLCNAAKLAKQKDYAGVFFDGILWAIFMVGLGLAGFNFVFDMIMGSNPPQLAGVVVPDLTTAGLAVMGVCLLLVLFFGGRREKGIFKKIIGGFGGIYGVIGYFSDVISYVRIFGILLSGAVFGSIINDLSASLGVLAPILLVFAHAFNLVLALLSVYVHNARLQYVEFFGKFFVGEGKLFTPFGSDLTYSVFK